MTEKNLIKFWLISAEDDFLTAETLLKTKRFNHSLFFCHLTLEKLLKGLVYKNMHKHASPIHELVKLAMEAEIKLSKKQKNDLKEINTWNIRARYDNYKREFYIKATEKFTNQWFEKVKEIYLWLKSLY